jgi:lipopolysaccharide transport system permease protein
MPETREELHEEFFGHEHITVIEPHKGGFDLKLKELWAYRDLILLFVRRDFVAQYKQTVLGPAWHFIKPLLTTIIFTIVFGNIAKISTDGAPPFLFYMAGTVIWAYFAEVLTRTSNTFIGNAGIFGKVYFPRLAVPVSILISQFIGFGVQFFFFMCFIAYFMLSGADLVITAWAWLTPVLLLMMAALGLGLGVIVSSVTTRYRDLQVLIGFGVQLFMYLSPVVYPVSELPEPYRSWMLLNPVAPIIETFRHAFLGSGSASLAALATSAVTISIILFFGVILFNRVERTFMDTV